MKTIILLVVILLSVSLSGLAQKNKKKGKTNKTPPPTTTEVKANPDNSPPPVISKIEQEILNELNSLRSNPQNYIQYLEEMKKSFSGRNYKNPQGIDIITVEGIVAVDDAIATLKKQTPIPVFKVSRGLTKAANLHLQDMVKNKFFSHRGSDQSLPVDRAGRFGTSPSGVTENLTEGSSTAREVILQMLVNDGLASRSQRKNLLNPIFKLVGISFGESNGSSLCVLVLADSFTEK